MMLIDSEKLRKVANYVAASQAVIEKQASQEKALKEGTTKVADALVRVGLLSEHLRDKKAAELAEDPAGMCAEVEKLASTESKAASLGKGIEADSDKPATADEVFVDRLMR